MENKSQLPFEKKAVYIKDEKRSVQSRRKGSSKFINSSNTPTGENSTQNNDTYNDNN
jgi:hypothetical protein